MAIGSKRIVMLRISILRIQGVRNESTLLDDMDDRASYLGGIASSAAGGSIADGVTAKQASSVASRADPGGWRGELEQDTKRCASCKHHVPRILLETNKTEHRPGKASSSHP